MPLRNQRAPHVGVGCSLTRCSPCQSSLTYTLPSGHLRTAAYLNSAVVSFLSDAPLPGTYFFFFTQLILPLFKFRSNVPSSGTLSLSPMLHTTNDALSFQSRELSFCPVSLRGPLVRSCAPRAWARAQAQKAPTQERVLLIRGGAEWMSTTVGLVRSTRVWVTSWTMFQ